MRIQYVLVFFTLTEAKKSKKKNSESETELNVPSYQKYYKVPFGKITLEGFDPAAKGPLDFEDYDFRYFKSLKIKDTPEVIPFVPSNEKDLKAKRRKWKRSKQIKKKREQVSQAFKRGMSQDRTNDSPQGDNDLPDGPENEKDGTEPKTLTGGVEYSSDKGGMYMDFSKYFLTSVSKRFKEGRSFAHGSLPDQAGPPHRPERPEPYPDPVIDDKNSERRYPDLSRFPPELRNRFRADTSFNWTTCEEFGRDAVFYPKDVININWVPFFVWSPVGRMMDSIVHTFEYPTIRLVQKYRKMASPMLKKKLDWEAPKLLMKTLTSETLIIAADRKGKFNGLRYIEVPENAKDLKYAMSYPVLSLHMKSLGSYLALMSCDDEYATIMAPSGTEPKTFDAAKRGAAFLKFNGTGFAVQRNLVMEHMIMQNKREMEAAQRAMESDKNKPIARPESFFPYNREPPVDTM